MISFRDMTFCYAGGRTCANESCFRYLTKSLERLAEKEDLLITWGCLDQDCDKLIPMQQAPQEPGLESTISADEGDGSGG